MQVDSAQVGSELGSELGSPQVLRGRDLRRAALAVLLRAEQPLAVGEILDAIGALGCAIDATYPRKTLADGLRYEHNRGWAARVGRGRYRVGRISRGSRWRILTQFG